MKDFQKGETQQYIDQSLHMIDELIKKGSKDEVYKEFIELIKKIESSEYQPDKNSIANVFHSFALFLFHITEYENFFKMLIKAQEYGFSKDEIEGFLYDAFIRPNLKEFKNIYEANIKFFSVNNYIKATGIPQFEELTFYLLSTGVKNEYYLFDKEVKLIREKINLFESQNLQTIPTFDSFSDYLLLEDWNLFNILSCSKSIGKMNKKTYIVLNNIRKFLSCLQGAIVDESILSDVLIFDSLENMNEYFMQSNSFLPRNFINLTEKSDKPQQIINHIHNYRTSKEYRNRNNVLLSICIPSYNRGKRAYDNVLHLLKSYYDEEIEIIVSNNGTQNESKEYYDKIRDINDSRVKYFAFDENMGFTINVCKICELASGKFILLISDEDLVNFGVFDQIMNILNQSQDSLSVLRTSSTSQNRLRNKIANSGKEAILNFMLTSNYMSGIILNNRLLKRYKGIEYIKENLNNIACMTYPHMYWELLLSQYGKVQGTDLILINEGKVEKMEDEYTTGISDNRLQIPVYATIEHRLSQHEGFTEVFKQMELCKKDVNLLREMYISLSAKTLFLVTLSINLFYKKTDSNFSQHLDIAYAFCTRKDFYTSNIHWDKNKYQVDINKISKYYQYFKKEIRV